MNQRFAVLDLKVVLAPKRRPHKTASFLIVPLKSLASVRSGPPDETGGTGDFGMRVIVVSGTGSSCTYRANSVVSRVTPIFMEHIRATLTGSAADTYRSPLALQMATRRCPFWHNVWANQFWSERWCVWWHRYHDCAPRLYLVASDLRVKLNIPFRLVNLNGTS